ncbi:hypothetical protein BV509_21365 [Rhodovulum sulfidophilum]|uniref:Tyr recombinase domain-containing protein n=1 Tax=Rhodovulum visakhapatnamense TaxID=364297 RepID=A0ABS1RAU1_9RHOB|nr:hypothetical protein [Rhodovulum visakhapatnamense]MBL3568882.1 hypothetical protein [Rhodovulum visakhapatnamense]MBL3576761.1 hypothetical protein [Rhodovulum visakhapatnamense]OLS42290.1 hypothetical protein BV509_21365 [Rhodovulum sulfidophilum]
MKLCDIHAALEAGQLLSGDRAFATLVAIEQLAAIEGIPVRTLGLAAPQFAQAYPLRDAPKMGMGRPRYQAWRKTILDAQMLFDPGDVDGDSWISLARAEILGVGKPGAKLYNFWKHLPAGTPPRDVTETLVGEIFRALPEDRAKRFRVGFASFLQLFDNDLARRTGLLPATKPARLPKEHDHFRLVPMAPDLRDWRTTLSARKSVNALDYLNRLCLAAGRLNGKTDALEDLRHSLPNLPNPESLGLPPLTEVVLRAYVTQLLRALGGPDPHLNSVEQSWLDLRTAARAAGCETSEIWAIGKPAAARGIPPSRITAADVTDIMRSYRLNSMPATCRKGCMQFDALRGIVPETALPPEPLGIRHIPRRRVARTPEAEQARRAATRARHGWKSLYVAFHARGWSSAKVSNTLAPLKARCVAAGHAPEDLTLDIFRTLEAGTPTAEQPRLRNAARHLRALGQDDPGYAMFCHSLPHIRTQRTHGGVPESCAGELEELLDCMNAAPTTRRSARVAIGVVVDALGRPDISLADVLRMDLSDLDLGKHEPRKKSHAGKLQSLCGFLDLPWTPAWRELQAVVVTSGLGAKDNPVPKVLAWHPGAAPNGVSLAWAQQLDRKLRSTLHNPPHGRADFAQSLARNLAAFDRLHDLPQVVASGLLPQKIGAIR